jgi:hypothetical protein
MMFYLCAVMASCFFVACASVPPKYLPEETQEQYADAKIEEVEIEAPPAVSPEGTCPVGFRPDPALNTPAQDPAKPPTFACAPLKTLDDPAP